MLCVRREFGRIFRFKCCCCVAVVVCVRMFWERADKRLKRTHMDWQREVTGVWTDCGRVCDVYGFEKKKTHSVINFDLAYVTGWGKLRNTIARVSRVCSKTRLFIIKYILKNSSFLVFLDAVALSISVVF